MAYGVHSLRVEPSILSKLELELELGLGLESGSGSGSGLGLGLEVGGATMLAAVCRLNS